MNVLRRRRDACAASLCAGLLLSALSAEAGPLLRRAQERRACQDFAGRLQAVGGNAQQAQQVYQQGVLKLVEQFGYNPCGDIPAPAATQAPNPTTANPAAPTPNPSSSATVSPEQRQACQQFGAKLQAAQGNPAQARQIYAMGIEKLSGRFGPDPCPGLPKP